MIKLKENGLIFDLNGMYEYPLNIRFTADNMGETLSIEACGIMFLTSYKEIRKIIKKERQAEYTNGHCIIDEEDSERWIPVAERLPETTDPVNITWLNHSPESYYADIKDKPFTATGHYHEGKWYWYSVTCQDFLQEYGRCEPDEVAEGIEIIAWRQLPEPYEKPEWIKKWKE